MQVENTIVKTAEDLRSAVKRGDANIEVQAHLDLTGWEMEDCGGGVNCILGQIPATVKSIRVRAVYHLAYKLLQADLLVFSKVTIN